ncbi:MAG: hypothetical protein ACLSUW_00430 [Akkermansia sp.]
MRNWESTITAPSIRKILKTWRAAEIPENAALRASGTAAMDRCSLALQLGGMMADGFVIVQCGKMNEVKPIALDLPTTRRRLERERVNRHAASLLKNAETGIWAVSNNLALIQSDVEQELPPADSDMANLIGLGVDSR